MSRCYRNSSKDSIIAVRVVLFSREGREAVTVLTGLDDQLNDLMKYIPRSGFVLHGEMEKKKINLAKGQEICAVHKPCAVKN